jgi:hypothetical protein
MRCWRVCARARCVVYGTSLANVGGNGQVRRASVKGVKKAPSFGVLVVQQNTRVSRGGREGGGNKACLLRLPHTHIETGRPALLFGLGKSEGAAARQGGVFLLPCVQPKLDFRGGGGGRGEERAPVGVQSGRALFGLKPRDEEGGGKRPSPLAPPSNQMT